MYFLGLIMKIEKPEFMYKSKEDDKELIPEFKILKDTLISRHTYEMSLHLKEKYGIRTISRLIDLALHYLNENKDKGDKLESLKNTIASSVSTLNLKFEDENFVKQDNLHIMEKISKDTWGGVEH